MGYLKNKLVYLAGPLEAANWDAAWRDVVAKELADRFALIVFDPAQDTKQQWVTKLVEAKEHEDYDEVERIARLFVQKDLSIVERSDFVIAGLPFKVPTTGTTHEIIESSNRKKPTILVCPEGKNKIPGWYFGIIRHKNYMYGSWDSLYSYLKSVDDGMHKDDRRWALVYDLI